MTRVLVVMVVVAQMLTCQSLLPVTQSPAATAAAIQHGIDHDVVCEPGAAAVVATAVRTAASAPCPVPTSPADPQQTTVVVTGPRWSSPAPAWAAQRLQPGRLRLIAIGITRV